MAFSSDLAKLVDDQLSRFVTLNRHQLAGQVAILDFWLAQVRNALDVIDGYSKRFEKLSSGQQVHVAAHGTTEFTLGNDLYEDRPGKPSPPRRVPSSQLSEARKSLCNSAYHLLIRCCNEGFISESDLRTKCDQLGMCVEVSDLKKRSCYDGVLPETELECDQIQIDIETDGVKKHL